MFQGLRTAIYYVPDINEAKVWYTTALGFGPYFDEPFYVGFNVGGYELGLHPDTKGTQAGSAGVIVYWGVDDIEAAVARLLELGATAHGKIQDVGEDILVATVLDPFGNTLGLIRNPHFTLES